MRSSADTLLIHGAVERYAGRLTEAVVNVLAHPSTELHLGLYKRGYWMFRREDGVANIRAAPTQAVDITHVEVCQLRLDLPVEIGVVQESAIGISRDRESGRNSDTFRGELAKEFAERSVFPSDAGNIGEPNV